MRGYRHRGARDVFMFPSSSGGYKNSTWLKLGVRGLLLFLLSSFSSCVMSFLVSPVLYHLCFCPFFLHFPFFLVFFFVPPLQPPLPPLVSFLLLFISPSGISEATCCWPLLAVRAPWQALAPGWRSAWCVRASVCVRMRRRTVMCSCMPDSECMCAQVCEAANTVTWSWCGRTVQSGAVLWFIPRGQQMAATGVCLSLLQSWAGSQEHRGGLPENVH